MPGESRSIRIVVSHGAGEFSPDQFARLGQNVVFEPGVLVFHAENIEVGDNVYVGHYAILKGYHKNRMIIGDGTWIGQQCFLHSAGGLVIGCNVGIGPGVKIVTSSHSLDEMDKPILHSAIRFAPVFVGDGSDIGVGATILPGVRIGRGVQVGAGSVVVSDVEDYAIVAGVPAKVIRMRK
jgi:acetyltransferase-like isoleucine patch superfamily enzyme